MGDVEPVDSAGLLARLRARAELSPLLAALSRATSAYVVGGTVRDLLLGLTPTDLDVVVEGPLAPVLAALQQPVRAHDQFETATVWLADVRCDLARARAEHYPRPGALPQVRPAAIEPDLRRRDFTVNALALGVSGVRRGQLLAVDEALGDLERRRLRVLHRASFIDDPTRLLRMARYGSRLGFAVESGTYALATEAVALGALSTVSSTRVGAELRTLADEPDPVAALGALAGLALDSAIALGFGLDGPALARAALSLLGDAGDRGALSLAVALLRVAEVTRAPLLDRLGFEASRRELILHTARLGPRLVGPLRRAGVPSSIASAVDGAPLEAVALAGALGAAGPAADWLGRLRTVRLSIGGADLIAAGVPAGPGIGDGLRAALAARLDGRVRDRDGELQTALGAARRRGAMPG